MAVAELKRDPRGSMSYWNTWTVFSESTIDSMWRQVNGDFENEADKPQFIFDIARRHADLMLYRYSRGDTAQEIASEFKLPRSQAALWSVGPDPQARADFLTLELSGNEWNGSSSVVAFNRICSAIDLHVHALGWPEARRVERGTEALD